MAKRLIAKFETPEGAKERLIGKAVMGYDQNGSSGRPGIGTGRMNKRLEANARFVDTERVMVHLFGGPADTDDADQFLEPYAAAARYKLLQTAKARGDRVSHAELARQIIATCRYWFPRIATADIEAVVGHVIEHRVFYTAARLGEIYRISDEVRQHLDVRTIHAIDVSPQQATKRRKEKKAAHAREQRRQAGAMTREQYLAQSARALAKRADVHPKTIHQWKRDGVLEKKLAERGVGYTSVADKVVDLTMTHEPVTSAEKKGARTARPKSQAQAVVDEGRASSPPPPSITPAATIEDRLLDHHGATGDLIDLGGRMFIRFRVPSIVLEVVNDAIAMFPPQEAATAPLRMAAKGSRR